MKNTRRTGIYVRISQDRDGNAASPARQLADCKALVESKGWTIVDVYQDRDESAYSKSAKRPQYRRMLADLETGTIDAICVWKLDRLGRRLTQVNEVVARIDELGATLLSVTESYDTSTPMGRTLISFIAAQAETESQNASTRIKRAIEQQIAEGKPHTGGSRCYSYTVAGEVIEEEAAYLRQAAHWKIEGVSFRQIAQRLNDAGAVTSNGIQWQGATIRRLLMSPRLGGYRLATDGKTLVKGAWQPIIDESLWSELQDALAETHKPARRNEAAHLLTGFAFCGLCGGRLNALKWLDGSGKPFPRLSCTKNPGRVNCGRLAASEAAVDRVVTEKLLANMETTPTTNIDYEAIGTKMAEDKRALDDLQRERFINRKIDQATYETLSAELRQSIEQAERELERSLAHGVRMNVASLTAHRTLLGAEAQWKAADLKEKRSIVAALIERVLVHPAARRGGNIFDESRVEIVWR